MSLKMQAAINQLNTRMGEWEKAAIPTDSHSLYNRISEMAARIEELQHRFNVWMTPRVGMLDRLNEVEAELISMRTRIETLEAKRKPGRPRKDER